MGRPALAKEDSASPGPIVHTRKDCSNGHCSCFYTNANACCFCKQTGIEPTWEAKPKQRRAFGERAEAAEAERQKKIAEKSMNSAKPYNIGKGRITKLTSKLVS